MASIEDIEAVTQQLGRPPLAEFDVVLRHADGAPMVIRNAPFLADGTPMPTRFWLVDIALNDAVARLESSGGVKLIGGLMQESEIAATHVRYALERDAQIPVGYAGPRPSGGVAGTARGLKCLHAHYAYFLAGGDDPVGRIVHQQLAEQSQARLSDELE